MKNIFRDFLTFNKRERNGVFILTGIICALILYLNISSRFINQEQVDFTKFDKDVRAFQASIKEKTSSNEYPEKGTPKAENIFSDKTKVERFSFDPNNLPEGEWKRLGLNEKQIKTIKNYESKGGRFRKKEDVKKMYCIKDELYASLEPFIQIASADDENRNNENTKAVFQNGKVENATNLKTVKTETVMEI
ncbi:MAG: hypothetical protein NTX97_12095 [Bacteroidetes bacterium]|nr:hypothetical protein [Bacteroidota bacterium]